MLESTLFLPPIVIFGPTSAVKDQRNLSTLNFCWSTPDGSFTTSWRKSAEETTTGTFEVGQTLAGRYLLKRELGNGAMGRVFLSHDMLLDRNVAIKVVMHPNSVVNLESMLQREAQLGANLNHRGIAAVYDFGVHEDKSYTVFEYVEGETLSELIRRSERIAFDEAAQIAGDLAAALDFAHALGVVHRDLKPANVCFTKGGEFKILDLGLAYDARQDIESGLYSGTPAYSSPEQAACKMTDGKSDQYALALIVFEMITGRKAFIESDPYRMLEIQINEPPPSPAEFVDLPDHAEQAILRALKKLPEDRFATCQEFVSELTNGSIERLRRRVVPAPADSRLGFYVAHVAEESLLARKMCEGLEQARYLCWFYGRDAIPGLPFANQSRAAIDRAQAVVVLISRAAIRSAEFEREIEYSYKVGCPILPLLIDISREEFEQLAPGWYRMLGVSPIIELDRGDAIIEIISRLTASAQSLDIAIDERIEPEAVEPDHSYNGHVWATDAVQIDIQDLQRVLFRNGTINDFLSRKHRCFISATKGFGKTLLLTCKRQLLTASSESTAVTMIPEGRPYLDFMSEMRSLSSRYERPLSDVSNAKRLWNAAFRISAISHHSCVIDARDESELRAFPKRIRRWLEGAKIQPTVVFKELTTVTVSELNQLIDSTENFLDQKLRQIHAGTYFFVDKVDQAIRHLSREAWIGVQAGLIEAAWEMMNANSHIKVFASIRQEAFSNYESDVKSNLFASTTNLDYSEEELRALLDQLAGCYEGCRSFSDFLGLNVVRHGRRSIPEDSFQYVRRHTCARPRDLVAIASEISSKRATLSERRLREVVQQTCSTVIIANVFDEVRVFLNCLGNRDARMRFLAEIPGNILDKDDAIRVCEKFNGLAAGTLEHFGEDSSDIYHPFRDLYVAGLLGVIEREPETGFRIQRFRRAHDSLTSPATELPDSPMFFIHPALDTFIRSQRSRTPFLQFQHVPVGDGLHWEPHSWMVVQIEKKLQQVHDDAFVESAHQIVNRIQSFLQSVDAPFARIEIETSDEWKALFSRQNDEACAEVLLWLDELVGEL